MLGMTKRNRVLGNNHHLLLCVQLEPEQKQYYVIKPNKRQTDLYNL